MSKEKSVSKKKETYRENKDYSYHFLRAAVIAMFLGIGMCLVLYEITLISIFQFSKINTSLQI